MKKNVSIKCAVCGTEYVATNNNSCECKTNKAQAKLEALKAAGVRRTVMLTGDRREVGEDVAKQLGLDEVHTELLPAEKVERVEALLEAKADGQSLIFVGDGMNDAPVLTCRCGHGYGRSGFRCCHRGRRCCYHGR